MMKYDRHGDTVVSLYRDVRAVRAAGPARLEFSVYVADKTDGIAIEGETEGRRTRLGDWQFDEGEWWSWVDLAVKLGPAGLPQKIHWMERKTESSPQRESALYVDDLRLVDEQSGRTVWSEDFDRNGWRCAGELSRAPQPELAIVDTRTEGDTPRYALGLSGPCSSWEKTIPGFDLSGSANGRISS